MVKASQVTAWDQDGQKPPAPPAEKKEEGEEGVPLMEASGLARFSVSVPETLYGSALMAPILLEYRTLPEWFQRSGETYIRLLLNAFLQSAFLIGVWQIRQWQADSIDKGSGNPADGECWRIELWFFIICMWIFFATVLTDVEETLYMTRLVWHKIPSVPETKILRYKDEDGGLKLVSGGMSATRKITVSLLILLPKMAIGVAMLYIGGSYLATSTSNTDMLLNSLAAVFIIELDELIYGFLVPKRMQRLMSEIPAFEDDEGHVIFITVQRCAMIIKLVLSGILVGVAHAGTTFCTNDPCYGSIRSCPVI